MATYLESWICCGSLCGESNHNNPSTTSSNSSMTEEELHCLRVANKRLEHEVQTLTGWNRRLEKELMASREQFEGERILVKCLKKDFESELKLARDRLNKKYESSLSEMKIRMQLEQSQSLELQRLQLERKFRADLMKCIHKKDSQLHLLFTHSQQVQREADKKRVEDRHRSHTSYEMYLENLKQDFRRQLTRLLLELKSKEHKIANLQRSFAIQITHPTSPSPPSPQSNVCRRNKSYYQRSATTRHPYPTELRKKRHAIMKETDDFQRDDDDCQELYVFHQYGGFPLETLPEVSEDESKPEESTRSSHHLNPTTYNLTGDENNKCIHSLSVESQLSDKIDFENESEKVSSLQATIRQLQDELRESKEQNELLEFRLLELEEFDSPSNRVPDPRAVVSGVEELQGVLCGAEVSSEATNNGDYESSNSHSSVAESRSSCSDCSESLSLQESGIFENQFSEDQSGTSGRSDEVGRELATLASQIESLVLSFGDGLSPIKSDIPNPHKRGVIGSPRGRAGHSDFPSELKSCRQRILEFERRLSKFTDVTYMHSLEDRVNSLIQENRRLEEERSEMEEAENDSRHQFQRLEEKMKELKGRNSLLQQQLSNEKRFIEQLRIQILQLQEGEEELCAQLSRVEALAQNYEQRNFELEESQIEIKCSLSIMTHSLPLLVLWYLWRARNCSRRPLLYRESTAGLSKSKSISPPPPPLPTTPPPRHSATRKHKLKYEMLLNTIAEPQLKKLRSGKEKPMCGLCEGSSNVNGGNPQVFCNAESQTTQDDLLRGASWISGEIEESFRSQITALECEIRRHEELFVLEKGKLLEQHSAELRAVREGADKRRQECERAEERWDCLIKELEQFAASVAKNLDEVPVRRGRDDSGVRADGSGGSTPSPQLMTTEAKNTTKSKGESLVAHRIRSLFPDEWMWRGKGSSRPSVSSMKPDSPEPQVILAPSMPTKDWCPQNEMVRQLVDGFEEQGRREKMLLDEIDGLKSEIKEKLKPRAEVANQMKEMNHLVEENNRLQMMLSEYESAWLNVKELEDENEKLTAELTSTATLERRLEESLATQKKLRTRIELLEQCEIHWKEATEESEKKGRKCVDALHSKLNFLTEEVEFLRTKCSQLQDELSSRQERETKFKLDIQLLNSKLELATVALEEREQLLESTELSLHSQMSKLREELKNTNQQLADSDCSNGMLSEEVEGLERALQDALDNTTRDEIQIKILRSDLEQSQTQVSQLEKEILLFQGVGGCSHPNDLDVFAKNEGGLIGVAREVNDILEIVQSCHRCKTAVSKLTEVSEQLNTLTLIMLGGSQPDCCVYPTEERVPNMLTRCESEEQLVNPPTTGASTKQIPSSSLDLHQIAEENLTLKSHVDKLQANLALKDTEVESIRNSVEELRAQMTSSAQTFLLRERNIKECHLNEAWWWKWRCQEKNDLIHLLARRLTHLSATDMHDYFLDGILKEIRQLRDSNYPAAVAVTPNTSVEPDSPQDCDSLLSFISTERRRIMDLLKDTCEEIENQLDHQQQYQESVDFRVLRRIGEESLLVSWTIPELPKGKLDGYEISVNGNMFLRIPKPNRYKALLFGLDMSEPLLLSLRCTGGLRFQESSITYIA